MSADLPDVDRSGLATTILDVGMALHAAGLSVLPAAEDGSKRPAVDWKRYQQQRADVDQLRDWFADSRPTGLGIVCGAVSGGLEVTELEGRAVDAGALTTLAELAELAGEGELWRRLTLDGWLVRSPSGGVHLLYRLADAEVPGNTKLAATAEHVTLAETRGAGGWVITAPSHGSVHPSGGAWLTLAGSVDTLPTITADERSRLHTLVRQLDERPAPAPAVASPFAALSRGNDGVSPGDDYAERTSWHELMTGAGWRHVFTRGAVDYWRRPGKPTGISATTGYGEGDWLYVFTSSTELEPERTYTKLGAYAALHHGGDHKAAAAALRAQGYGSLSDKPPPTSRAATPANGKATRRRLKLTSAAGMRVLRMRWLWQQLLPLGALALLAGREGIGKSTLAYTVVAAITRGALPGEYQGQPRAVLIVATEDSWEHTIVPRLIAAGADLSLVYRVEATTGDVDMPLVLPVDLPAMEEAVSETGAALVLLDPLMSRLPAGSDSHKDAEVRQALEPLTAFADRAGVSVLGLMHVNKGKHSDPTSSVMASRAFTAVARAVLFVVQDPEDPTVRHLGLPKANLAPTDVPNQTFRIESATVAGDDGQPVTTGRLVWTGTSDRPLQQLIEAGAGDTEERSAVTEAAEWLVAYLGHLGGTEESAKVKDAARRDGHADRTLDRARKRARINARRIGQPPRTWWSLPEAVVDDPPSVLPAPGETTPNGTTGTTGVTGVHAAPVTPVAPAATDPPPAGIEADVLTFPPLSEAG